MSSTQTVTKHVGGKLAERTTTKRRRHSTTHTLHVSEAPDVVTHTKSSPDYAAAAGTVAQGGKNLAGAGGAVVPILAVSVGIVLLARARGATINVERTLVASFLVALVLTLVAQANPALATAFAALVLIQVVLEFGHTALGGIGSVGTSKAAIPQVASAGDLAAGAAAVGGTYLAYKAGAGVVSGLGEGAGIAAGAAGAKGASSLWSKLKNILGGAAEDAAPVVAEGAL